MANPNPTITKPDAMKAEPPILPVTQAQLVEVDLPHKERSMTCPGSQRLRCPCSIACFVCGDVESSFPPLQAAFPLRDVPQIVLLANSCR
jgi:hypothetical protein